ncbi:MAG: hypothetical protein C4308_13975 [Chitinophagaceae bacterium]
MRHIRPVKPREETNRVFAEVIAAYETAPHLGRWAVIEKASELYVGSFVIIPVLNEPELIQLGYALLKNHWGKGFATELTIAGLKHAFQVMKLQEIYGLIEEANELSQKVLLKAGFSAHSKKPEGEKTMCWFICKRTTTT